MRRRGLKDSESIKAEETPPAVDNHQERVFVNREKGETFDYHESVEETPWLVAVLTYLFFAVVTSIGHIRDLLLWLGLDRHGNQIDKFEAMGFVRLYNDYEAFFTRNVYRRTRDIFNRPIGSCPGATIEVLERETTDNGWSFHFTGKRIPALNMGSYNYLGFAEPSGPCAEAAKEAITEYGIGTCSTRQEAGTLTIHRALETLVANYLGVEDAIAFPMGFATNALNMPALIGNRSLILSDELNHCSLVLGCRLCAGTVVRTFKHGDMQDLEKKIREGIVNGHPRNHRPWKKIFIIVEGIYSMEGSMVKLPDVIRLKKKYKCYLYLDEAHSIGAVGPNGRGVVDFFGCDTRDVDILMGTFTKSFGSAGGYIAGSKTLIDFLRATSHATVYGACISPPVAMQIISAFRIMMGLDGTDNGQKRIKQLAINTRYFRYHLHRMGFIVYGNRDSPVVPVLFFNPAKGVYFARTLLEKNIAIVAVGFPATPILGTRVRFCISAMHTKEMLDYALKCIDEVADNVNVKVSSQPPSVLRELQISPPDYDQLQTAIREKSPQNGHCLH